jgi:hypothetical protein
VDTRIPFVLDDDESLKSSWLAWQPRIDALLASGMPMNMADGDDGGGDGAGDSGEAGDGEGDDPGKAGASAEGAGDADSDDDDDGDGGDDSEAAKAQAELAGLKRRFAEERKAKTKLERELRKAQNEKRQEQGEYEQMYKDEKKRADDLEEKLKTDALNRTIIDAATDLKFYEPSLVPSLVKVKDAVDEDGEVDETLVKKAVQALAKRSTYLIREGDKPQGAVRGERRPASTNGDRSPADVGIGIDRTRYAYEKSPK